MASGSVSAIKKIVLPQASFTFSGAYYDLGAFGVSADRIIGLYISYLDDNSGAVSLALGTTKVYAIGSNGTTITNLEATIVYI